MPPRKRNSDQRGETPTADDAPRFPRRERKPVQRYGVGDSSVEADEASSKPRKRMSEGSVSGHQSGSSIDTKSSTLQQAGHDTMGDISVKSIPAKRKHSPKEGPNRESPIDGQSDECKTTEDKASAAGSPMAGTTPLIRRSKRQKADTDKIPIPDNVLKATLAPLTEDKLREWPNWITLESDPDIFTHVLRELGVKSVKFHDVYSISSEELESIPNLEGLIFCSQYASARDHGVKPSAEDLKALWFANQTVDRACGTIAMLNLVMNINNLELGELLNDVKVRSRDLPAPLRGDLIARQSPAIRAVHNSFSRRTDHLNAAWNLQNKVAAAEKKKKQVIRRAPLPKRSTKARSKAQKEKEEAEEDDEADYHFIAFVPVGDKVWHLDGLNKEPVILGEISPGLHWTELASGAINEIILAKGDNIDFNLLALCRDPCHQLRIDLATNVACLQALEARWKDTDGWARPEDAHVILNADSADLVEFDLDREQVEALSSTAANLAEMCSRCCIDDAEVTDAFKQRDRLCKEQGRIRNEYMADALTARASVDKATELRQDHTATIREWCARLAERGLLEELFKKAKAGG